TRWPRDWSSDVCSSDLQDASRVEVRLRDFARGAAMARVIRVDGVERGCRVGGGSETEHPFAMRQVITRSGVLHDDGLAAREVAQIGRASCRERVGMPVV